MKHLKVLEGKVNYFGDHTEWNGKGCFVHYTVSDLSAVEY